jgi:hypothetical protein
MKTEKSKTENVLNVPPGCEGTQEVWGAPFKWNPREVGEFISGTFSGIRTVSPVGSEPFKLVEIMTEDGPYSVGGHIVTETLFKDFAPGTRVTLQYTGEVQLKDQISPMKNYRIYIH